MNSGDSDGDRNRYGDKSSSSSKKLLSKEVQGELKDRRDEQNLFARFKNVAADALERMSRQEDEQHYGGDVGEKKFQMGTEEARIIQNLNGIGLMEGAAAGVVTFFVLRRGPIYFARYLRRRQMAQQNAQQYHQSPPPSKDGYRLSDPNNMNNNNPFQRASSQQEFPRSRSFVVRSIWFMFDVTLSLMMAASTSMAFTDTDKIRQQIINMPLVEGASLTSDALCDPIVQELAKIKSEKDPTYERLQALHKSGNAQTPASTYLDNITKFAENCQRRRYMERRIRQEQGRHNSSDRIEIPSPGVPKNGPRIVVENEEGFVVHEDGTTEPLSSDGFGFSDNDGFGPDMTWADETNYSDSSSSDRGM
ncbi:MAG: hypothetical protein SGILL_007451 [Bacillariaceae sp.]